MEIEEIYSVLDKVLGNNEPVSINYSLKQKIIFFIISREFSDLKAFNELSEDGLASFKNETNKDLDKKLNKFDEGLHHAVIEDSITILRHSNEKFFNIHRHSQVISIYNVFEFHLNEICGLLKEKYRLGKSPKDSSGQGVERALNYMKKEIGIDFGDFGKELPFVRSINAIRNLIVHNGGLIAGDTKKSLIEFFEASENISIDDNGFMLLNKNFISEVIENFGGFFEKLDGKIEKHEIKQIT